jgi:PAS domain S-box-containing protein
MTPFAAMRMDAAAPSGSRMLERRTRAVPAIAPAVVDADTYRVLVESIPEYAIFMLDPQGLVRTWNLGAQRIKGYDADEIIGRHFSVFYPADRIAEGWPEHELQAAAAAGVFEDEGWRLRKDGSRFWANVVITRLDHPDGSLRGFAKITRDLTSRRHNEERLRLSEERFRLLVDSVRDYAIFMLDPQGRIVSWNLGAQLTKGYLAEEVVGRHFSMFYPDEQRAAGWPEKELDLALRNGRLEDEGWRLRKDGSRYWAEVIITPIHDENGRHAGFAKVTRDLTEKRRVRTLEDEGRRLTTFIAMLGHELRNPIAPIANAVSILQLEEPESERVRMCRDIIARQVGQLRRLVDDLLDIGRITTGKIHLAKEIVPLSEVMDTAAEMVDPLLRERGHLLVVDAGETPLWVSGDRARLVQVLGNLLNNAAKFTPPGGRIELRLRESGDRAEISVRDNGQGIDPQRLPDIFNLFVQAGPEEARAGGLGLGLSLVQQLVALHGGDISAFSVGQPGKGAEFVVSLPLEKAPG